MLVVCLYMARFVFFILFASNDELAYK